MVVSVGTFLSAMAGSMVNLALPSLGRDLAVSLTTSRWVVQVMLLVMGALLLVAGRLGDIIGHRLIYLVGFVLFGAASLVCGLVNSFGWLVVARALQGVGGAMVLATSPALLTLSFPVSMRGRALGMQATATYLGLALGPALGGLIVTALGWRWTFFVYVPASAAVLVLGALFLPARTTKEPGREPRRIDVPGVFLLVLGLPLLLLSLSWSRTVGSAAGQALLVAGLGLVLLAVFIIRGLRVPDPLYDLRMFRSRLFTSAVLCAVCNYVALFAVLIILPFYLEEGLGMSPAMVGAILTVQPAVMALTASPSGWLSDRIGSRWLSAGGLALLSAGILGLSTQGLHGNPWSIVPWLGLVGLGVGLFVSPNSSAMMGAASRKQQGQAGAMMAESRIVGMFLGVAISSAVFAAAGGRTGGMWRPQEFQAMGLALKAGAGAALLGALAAMLRGRTR
jgi:EmrB/QacA subfamily drug resistance transporter